MRFVGGIAHHCLAGHARLGKRLHKPQHPRRCVNGAGRGRNAAQPLRMVERVVISGAGFQHLVRHAIHAHQRRAGLGILRVHVLRQRHVGQGAAQAAVAVFKRVNRLKPQVYQRRTRNAIQGGGTRCRAGVFKPRQQAVHLSRDLCRRRRFVMHHLAPQRPADDLHGIGVVAHAPHRNACDARRAPRKQGRLPAAQPVQIQRLAVVGQCVSHHLHQTVHRPVSPRRICQLEAVCHRRAQGLDVELLPLNGGSGQCLLHPQLALHGVGLLQPNGTQ